MLDLSGEWQIHLEDTTAGITSLNSTPPSWGTITLPGNVAKYSLEKKGIYIGTAWLQKTVYIPKEWAGQDLGLCLGRISHADETFINGKKIGKTGAFPPKGASMWNITRYYTIPRDLVHPGRQNTIRMHVWFHTYGDISGKLYLADYNTITGNSRNTLFSVIIFNYTIIAMGVPLFLVFALFYARRRESSEYFYYCLQLICGLFIVLDTCMLWRFPGGLNVRFKLLAFSWIALNLVHPVFLHRLYNLQRKRVEQVLFAYLVISVPFYIFVTPDHFRLYGLMVAYITGTIGFYNISCHLSALYLKRPYARLFALFGITNIIGAMHDGVIYTAKLQYFNLDGLGKLFNVMLFPPSAAALYMGTAIVLVYRFTDIMKANEDLNLNLETKVEERTRSLVRLTDELEQKNTQFKEMAIRDSLTTLYNHAAFCDRLDEVFINARSDKTSMAVIMIDLDDFRQINDTQGHQVGDAVLIKVAEIVKNCIREYEYLEKNQWQHNHNGKEYDLAGRYGGDEFILALPGCDRDTAFKTAERINRGIKEIDLASYPPIHISASFGIAVLDPATDCSSSDKLITLVDTALHKSKSMATNQIHCMHYRNV
ncbi:MAG: diguanylate cyclase [Thermodesulfobacteriota bacterium]|nr:diguanylate cyclase [Thermodesulfobacteriota bacterium]